jgi:hypothetical protein
MMRLSRPASDNVLKVRPAMLETDVVKVSERGSFRLQKRTAAPLRCGARSVGEPRRLNASPVLVLLCGGMRAIWP